MTGAEELAELVQLLQSGHSPAQARRELVPESWRPALRACAAAEVVTAELYGSVLRCYAGDTPPELADLAERGFIEPVPSESAAWRVPQAQAAEWMHEWEAGQSDTGAAPELAELESVLARWYEERGDRNEQLRHLMLASPRQAVALFAAMFEEADRRRDFACCQDLLDVLADPKRSGLVHKDVFAAQADRAGFLRARLHWTDDYARSAQFSMPPGLPERTERLVAGTGPRVWQLFAEGGTGKTIQLQWLAARYCVTSANDIPCARIDFDVIDPVNVARHPWLLLLEVAEQLELRCPRRIFERLDRFSSYRNLAQRRTSDLSREAAQSLGGLPGEELQQLVMEIFVRRLNAYAGQRPVVLIVDTLEEALLSGGGGVDRLLGLLGELVRQCPSVRLIVAGRYDLREKAPLAMAAVEPAETYQVTNFTPQQANDYLQNVRGIDDQNLRDAVAARTKGQPFLLALFADVIEEDPGITADELRKYREPTIRLLIDRVIQRIPDPDVRWLVRYGVVPRRLRFDDVVAVMGSFMARGRLGPSDLDDPRADQHHLCGRPDVFPFGDPPQDEAALRQAWRRLLSYAARPSWVSSADGGRSVVFHPNVRGPMQDLIRDRLVFRQLHVAFRDRFEQLAVEDPASSVAYLREAVYHRVQLADPDAPGFWRKQVTRYRDRDDLDAVEELASELLRDEYVKNDLPRRRGNGEPLLAHEALVEAHVLNAYVAAERARAVRADADDPLWSSVQRSLASAAFVRAHSPRPAPPSSLEVGLRSALLITDDEPARAANLAGAALRDTTGPGQVDLLRAVADALVALGQHGPAEARYRDGLALATKFGRADQEHAIVLSLAVHSETQGRLDKAITWIRHSAGSAVTAVTAATDALRALQCRLLIDCYQPDAALRLLAGASSEDPAVMIETGLLRAEAYRVLGRARHALNELQAAASAAEQMPASASSAYLAQIHQLRGVVLGELLAVDEAEDSFQRATSLWGEMGFLEGHPECSYLYRRFLMRHLGDLAAAARVPRPAMKENNGQALLWDEQGAELQIMEQGNCEPLAAAQLSRVSPRQAARIIAVRLARSWSRHRYLLPELGSALQKVSPPSARLVVLEELRRCDRANHDDIHALTGHLQVPAPESADDAALQRGLLAELDRLQGCTADAAHALDEVAAAFPPPPSAELARWRWLQTRSRLRQPPLPPDQRDLIIAASPGYPLLQAACLLALASATRSSTRKLHELREAKSYCEHVSRPTCWAADVLAELGRRAPDPSLLAWADDMNRQLGRPHRSVPARWSGPILRDRPGEQAISLFGPDQLPDLIPLQRRLVADWPQFAREMGSALFSQRNLSHLTAAEPIAVRLKSAHALVQALPWELTIPPGDFPALAARWPTIVYRSMPAAAERVDTRWLQRWLSAVGPDVVIDGVPGPSTLDSLLRVTGSVPPVSPGVRAELERYLSRMRGDGPPVAIVLRPDPLAERGTSSRGDWYVDAGDRYRRAGFQVRTVHSLPEVRSSAGRNQVSVLHVTARMDDRGTGPYFDFSPADAPDRMGYKSRGADVHPKDVARWLRACDPGLEPLVVLDPPYPGSRFDVPWQLLLRNYFAATLFAEAVSPAIIGTGVRDTGPTYITQLAQCVAEGSPLAEIAAALRPRLADNGELAELIEAGWQSQASKLAELATAVFAAPSAYALPFAE
jgi:tetratricopeptide (TPR) repeat protein